MESKTSKAKAKEDEENVPSGSLNEPIYSKVPS